MVRYLAIIKSITEKYFYIKYKFEINNYLK
jgi:hypothetical protein